MTFYDEYLKHRDLDIDGIFSRTSKEEVLSIIGKEQLSYLDFLKLLSPAAEDALEEMAQAASRITTCQFGKSINLYTPIYIANHCINNCAYCGFSIKNKISRDKLTLEEIDKEASLIAEKGIKHILLLTGESEKASPVEYLRDAVGILKKYFSSIGIEVYPLDEDKYRFLVESGVDSLTIYQETYDEETYDRVHLSGPKKDYLYRLLGPERGARAGMYSVGVGALMGLSDNWRRDAFFTGLHARYLMDSFPEVNVSISMPRIRPEVGGFSPSTVVSDMNIVQYILASRIFLPRATITISTRESEEFRNNLLPLGVNKISAESNTAVGSDNPGSAQFEISDDRTLEEIAAYLKSNGYRPVMKDWDILKV